MIEIYISALSIFLLAILLTFLPLSLTNKGKTAVILSGTMINILWNVSKISMYSNWVVFPIIFLLISVLSYLLVKRVTIFYEKTEKDQQVEKTPLFAYETLKEKAESAVTIDDYYFHSINLEKRDQPEMDYTIKRLDQDEIDRLLNQEQNEVAVMKDSENLQKEIIVGNKDEDMVDSGDKEIGEVLPEEREILLLDVDDLKVRPNSNTSSSVDYTSIKEAVKEDFHEGLPLPTKTSKLNIEEVDLNKRDGTIIDDFQDKSTEDGMAANDIKEIMEKRKKIFSHLEETPKHVLLDLENIEEVPKKEQIKTFTSQKLEAAFEDLEEYYIQQKSSLKEEEKE